MGVAAEREDLAAEIVIERERRGVRVARVAGAQAGYVDLNAASLRDERFVYRGELVAVCLRRDLGGKAVAVHIPGSIPDVRHGVKVRKLRQLQELREILSVELRALLLGRVRILIEIRFSAQIVQRAENKVQPRFERGFLRRGRVVVRLAELNAAADGDTVNIDYAGSVDGVAFSGGTYSGYSLTLGSGTFIDGFEDQIVGHTPGETFDVTVTFPEGYSDSTDSEGNTVVLSGKKAVFSVTLNYISEKVLPELTDAWVAENYGESDDVHTVEELKALYQKMLYNTNLQNAIMDDLLANSTFKELPKEVTDYQVNQCLNYYYTMANYYGYDLDSFVQTAAGYENADALLEGMSDSITTYSKEALLYQAVAETLDIVPTQEQIDTYSSYTDTYGENYCTMVALMDAVTDALTESAVVS